MDNTKLREGLAIAVTAIAGEHMFSTFLSSPWTTQKFADTPEDKEIVKQLFCEESLWTLAFSFVMAYYMESYMAVVTAIILIIGYWHIYDKALKGEL